MEKWGGRVRRIIFLENCAKKNGSKISGKDWLNCWVVNLKVNFVEKLFNCLKNSFNKFNGKIGRTKCFDNVGEQWVQKLSGKMVYKKIAWEGDKQTHKHTNILCNY